ncbi:MAG TPA: hypothetical protein VGL60_08005 [Acidimicrobiales bacterium]|jgi:hypothetical protein
MGRVRWLAAGATIGAGGTLWARRRLRRRVHQAVDRLAPSSLSQGVGEGARQVGDRVRGAFDAGRRERARREAELRQHLAATSPSAVVAGPAGGGSRAPAHARHGPTGRPQGRRHEQARQ